MNRKYYLFPLTLGLSDGIITTIMLVSRTLLSHEVISIGLALRVSSGSAFVGGFSFFVAEYSRLREEISRTSRQLVLRSPRYLIRGKIGKEILTEAVTGTTISVFAGFGGSLIPLLSSVYIPGSGLFPVVLAIASLALLGAGIGRSVSGNYVFWVLTLVSIGILVTIVGNYLNLV
ncbi:MAG: hypothetical protein AAE983_04810 [Thermoplasmataceae archaeon]|jgi:VIT1/CCC1 family predicted Fe2+/Mn2+ transporter